MSFEKIITGTRIVFLFLFTVSCTNNSGKTSDLSAKQMDWVACTPQIKPFALVELFSSESCYDCPAAEDILNKLIAQGHGDSNLIFMAAHVDYWNDLIDGEGACEGNWIDEYSSSHYTSRQFAYGKQLAVRPVTPQFIINGHYVVNGADADTLKQKMQLAYADTAMFGLCLTPDSSSDIANRKLVVNYMVERAANLPTEFRGKVSPQVLVFLVERNVITKPTKGENCNKELHHMNIARAFNGHTLYGKASKGSVEITVPEKINLNNCYIIGFVQNLRNLQIVGASSGFKLK